MTLTGSEAQRIVCNDEYDWEEVPNTREIIGHHRWRVDYKSVFHHISSNKYYRFYWSIGATEMQDEQPYEYTNTYSPIEVVEKEVTVKQWVIKEL